MKALIVVDSLRLGGAENVLATLAKAAPGAGLSVEVVSLAPLDRHADLLPVLTGAGLPVRSLSIPRLAHPRAIPAVARAILASRCDVVHAHLEYAATLVPVAAALVRRPAVCTLHHVARPLPAREAAKERLAVAAANRGSSLVFVSATSLDSFARRYGRRPSWTVIPNGVDLSRFRPEPADWPAELGIPADAPTVTIVAALRPEKGHAVALTAWPQVLRRFPQARLCVVGSGAEDAALRQLASNLGIANRVVFAGARTDVPRLLRASTLSLLPTLNDALPTSLIESAACGRAVVASRVGGVHEITEHGRTGLLVPPGDPDAMAGAVVALLADGGRRAAMQVEARRLAQERFDMHVWAARLAELYARVSERRVAPMGVRRG